jgi:capsular polysaccharide biosynthesis protein
MANRRRRLGYSLLILLIVTAAARAAFNSYVSPATYKATALLYVEPTPYHALESLAFDQAEFTCFRESQEYWIANKHAVLEPAISEIASLRLLVEQSDPVAFISSKLSISYTVHSNVIEVSIAADTDHPEHLATIVDAIVNQYLRHHHRLEQDKVEVKMRELTEQLNPRQAELDALDRELLTLQAVEEPDMQQKQTLREVARRIKPAEKMFEQLQWRRWVLQGERESRRARVSIMSSAVVEQEANKWWRIFGD